ncbi:hypothetical protein E1I69_07025 [Bacillus timonensis]|uniref:Transporter n=1 Tax=Bacillus timonensis TaxID=1033734 RepID=A0A4S3PV34_9BACI|nr:hypothetical protein [Bacillus timonensis]THE13659.1 hypothetical protein E1I69_07025 [Bacillus timonensis]
MYYYDPNTLMASSLPYYSDYDYYNEYERQMGSFMPPFGGGSMMPPFGPPSQGPGGVPPFGPPSQGPGGGPPFGTPGQGQGVGAPTAPPPSFVPQQSQQAQAFAVDPGSIRGCLFRYTYVWLKGREQFWFYPTFVGRRSVSGYRWTGFRWIYFGISLRQIQSFTCV